jgi:hypothetical protein
MMGKRLLLGAEGAEADTIFRMRDGSVDADLYLLQLATP